MGKLILVRHGESEGNALRRFTDSPEVNITELGRRQALEAAQRIKAAYRPRLVVASPYRRAHETARIIATELALEVELAHDFREQSLGALAGQSYDVVREDPTFDAARSWLWRPPGGESQADVRARSGPLLDTYARRYAIDEIVIVSHGGVMRALWAHATDNWESAHLPINCGIVVIVHRDGRYGVPEIVHGRDAAEKVPG
jgi:broad specificity phosphatase PhoE